MDRLDMQTDYWNRVGLTKTFSHPINIARWSRWVSKTARILDYGCGYGRTLGILHSHGYTNLIGVDPAAAMIAAASHSFPSLLFDVLNGDQSVNLLDGSVDAVLLFAVLTCVPTNEGQRAILAEIARLLRPAGVLYISDMLLQTDPGNIERYAEGEKKHGIYGVFDLPEGATVRHHERAWIENLTADYEALVFEEILVQTMNGHSASGFQWLGRKNRTI